MRRLASLVLVLALLAPALAACGGAPSGPSPKPTPVTSSNPYDTSLYTQPKEGDGVYDVPSMRLAEFHENLSEGTEDARIDISAVRQGYVAVCATSDVRLKFQVRCEAATYNYDISGDGTPAVFPLQSGNASYTFRVMENVSGTSYAEMYATTIDVTLEDEFAPFLVNNNYVRYAPDSYCIRTVQELSLGASSSVMVVARVYDFICKNITYDKQKAATVGAGYVPDPDQTLADGRGICFDYAALAAAMLRAMGIPTKMVFGNVEPNGLYHAWNMFYTEETGWVTAGFSVREDEWNRIDLTFSANGADRDFIGDGSNYTDLYYY